MTRAGRNLQRSAGPVGAGAPVVEGGDPWTREGLEAVLLTLESTGAGSRMEALLSLVKMTPLPWEAVRHAWLGWVQGEGEPRDMDEIFYALRSLGEAAPWLAGKCLSCAPKGLEGIGAIRMDRSLWMESLPEDMRIKESLHLNQCENLQALPKGLTIGKTLYAPGCKKLKEVNGELRIGNSLVLSRAAIRTLPEGLKIPGQLKADKCPNLQSLPDDLKVGKDLNVSYCPLLKALPPGLTVRHLLLDGCRGLESLPNGLVVKKNLHLQGCERWDKVIPRDAKIGGLIHTNRHPFESNFNPYTDDPVKPKALTLQQWRERYGFGPGA